MLGVLIIKQKPLWKQLTSRFLYEDNSSIHKGLQLSAQMGMFLPEAQNIEGCTDKLRQKIWKGLVGTVTRSLTFRPITINWNGSKEILLKRQTGNDCYSKNAHLKDQTWAISISLHSTNCASVKRKLEENEEEAISHSKSDDRFESKERKPLTKVRGKTCNGSGTLQMYHIFHFSRIPHSLLSVTSLCKAKHTLCFVE